MGRAILLAASFASLFTSSSRALACKCDEPKDVADALARADLVFVGHPVARFARWDRFHQYTGWDYAFEIEKLWKGQLPTQPLVFSMYGGCGQIFARQVSYLVFASLTEDGFETGRCEYWDGGRHPVTAGDPAVRALGPPLFEAKTSPPGATEAGAREDFGWRSKSPVLDPDLPDFDPRPPPASHVVRDALLIVAGIVLALATSWSHRRCSREPRRRSRHGEEQRLPP
jgi:hypothetical protein